MRRSSCSPTGPGAHGRFHVRNNVETVTEICQRLDGMPLAIELAAARVRALSLDEIVGSLHDRFRLLTGGARTAVRRQQTLRASVDWSHALLTEPERVLLRRLAVFMAGFDLDAAQAVAGDHRRRALPGPRPTQPARRQVTRHRRKRRRPNAIPALETVRQYALEKLGESGEADDIRARHRDHYTAMAARLDAPSRGPRNASSNRPISRSTTYEPRSPGVARITTLQKLWSLRHRCSHSGWCAAAWRKEPHGSTPH